MPGGSAVAKTGTAAAMPKNSSIELVEMVSQPRYLKALSNDRLTTRLKISQRRRTCSGVPSTDIFMPTK